ncbi:tetratricopeptide repeat protein [Candidatus Thiosymbion oneisti]|uniref:tetratricopeptide repeat protein n=1 Tax=Candidatus Thiosymbion oneisti TaxID=589554 RepID=UPI00105D0CB6|nr:tetratricopeptide repeat protein [Candidatus Thiosymbion oneisti]
METSGLDDETRARVYHQIGIAQFGRSWFRAAAAAFGQAIGLMEALRKALGERWPPGMQNDLAKAYMNRGNALQGQQDYAGAVATYDAAIALMERLRTALGERWSPRMQNDLSTSYYNRALLHSIRADLAAAAADLERAVDLGRQVAMATGSPAAIDRFLDAAYLLLLLLLLEHQTDVSLADRAARLLEQLDALGARWPPSHWPAGLRPNLERVRTLGQRLVGDTPGAR